jgi:phosphoenolpyruvate---glycerone phosphotransferase subunit DhaL
MNMDHLTVDTLIAWINLATVEIEKNKAYLTELDAPIGDSDHGANMARGFAAVSSKLQPGADDPAMAMKLIGMTLISTVGGSAGPLYGTMFLQAASKAGGKKTLSLTDWTECLEAGLAGLAMRGKAEPGEKTMVDALIPAVAALKSSNGIHLAQALLASADAAEMGMKSTIPMLARKGRASYLGERSIGHQDPGATSMHIILRALAEVASK